MTPQELCEAVHAAVERYVLSRVRPADVLDLDVGVRLEGGDLTVDVFVVTAVGDDEALARGAVDAAMEEGDRLLGDV